MHRDQGAGGGGGEVGQGPGQGEAWELLLGGLEDKLGKIAEVVEDKAAEEVTSIRYTDEGGREQSLVGKIVYQTDESGQSNIVIEEVQQQVEG